MRALDVGIVERYVRLLWGGSVSPEEGLVVVERHDICAGLLLIFTTSKLQNNACIAPTSFRETERGSRVRKPELTEQGAVSSCCTEANVNERPI